MRRTKTPSRDPSAERRSFAGSTKTLLRRKGTDTPHLEIIALIFQCQLKRGATEVNCGNHERDHAWKHHEWRLSKTASAFCFHFCAQTSGVCQRLGALCPSTAWQSVARWQSLARSGKLPTQLKEKITWSGNWPGPPAENHVRTDAKLAEPGTCLENRASFAISPEDVGHGPPSQGARSLVPSGADLAPAQGPALP